MNKERMYQVIRYPHISEKTARLQADSNQYVFEVSRDATREEIRKAVEGLFEVDVEQVRTLNVKGKTRSFRFRPGRQKNWKKAYVRIRQGQAIADLQPE
jgi:large subunit ribosomal protein L23